MTEINISVIKPIYDEPKYCEDKYGNEECPQIFKEDHCALFVDEDNTCEVLEYEDHPDIVSGTFDEDSEELEARRVKCQQCKEAWKKAKNKPTIEEIISNGFIELAEEG